jgi:hypothetical protein
MPTEPKSVHIGYDKNLIVKLIVQYGYLHKDHMALGDEPHPLYIGESSSTGYHKDFMINNSVRYGWRVKDHMATLLFAPTQMYCLLM